MDSDRQSTAPPSSAGSGRVVAPVLSLLLLLGVCALRLDGREFSIGEANHAWAALGALEGDARTPGSGPAHGFLRGFGTAVTTTPRGLRLSVVLGLILAALLVGEIACRLHGPTARPFAYVAVAACPLAGAGTLLYPGLLAMLPMAALLGVAVFLVRGGPGWMIIATVGAAGAACTAPLPIVVLTIIAIPWLVPFHPRPVGTAIATVIPLGVVGATTWASGVPAWPLAAPARALDEPSVFDVFFESGLTGGLPFLGLAVVCVFVIGAAHPSRRRRVMARGAVLVAAAVGYGAWMMIDAPATGDTILSPSATAFGVLVPAGALLVAGGASRSLSGGLVAAGLLLAFSLLAWLPVHDRATDLAGKLLARLGGPDATPAPARDYPLRDTLDQARTVATPGGRLVLSGEDRYALLYYAARGHDPGVPILLVPDDLSWDSLAEALRDRLRVTRGREALAPPILVHPRPTTVPPGFLLLPAAPSTMSTLQLAGS